jgi:hypothetical protein
MGCSLLKRTKAGSDFCDLGVWAHPQKTGYSMPAQIPIMLI